MQAKLVIRFVSLLMILAGIVLGATSAWAEGSKALVLTVKGAINPVSAAYIARGIEEANRDATRTRVVVIALDTPGGLDTSMREIVQKEIASKVPVVVWVGPPGARAASAGLFVMMGAHLAAMAPNTATGAAHPVAGGGEEIKGDMAKKVEHDAAAYIRGLAKERGRNADWAERAVRKSVSLSASEALEKKVIEVVAGDLTSLLKKIDGRKVKMAAGPLTLRTKDAPIARFDMTGMERLLYTITDPSIAFILLNLGMLGMFFELSNPGSVLPGVIGGICLLLAFFGLGLLPVNYAGVALILFAFLLFIAELFAPTHGVLTIGGVISLVLGGFVLMSGSQPGLEVSPSLIFTVAGSTGALFATCIALALRAQGRKPTTGREDLIGRHARVKEAVSPVGQVFIEGERWKAVSEDGQPIAAGADVVIRCLEDLTLVVAPVSPPETAQAPSP